jgi:cytochrome c oxidase cbb3-type subunit 3
MAGPREIDQVSGTETTGHEWDGIKELNTPLPRWWLYVLYATIVWSALYVIAMPAIPYIAGYTRGLLGHSQRAKVADALEAERQARRELTSVVEQASLDEIMASPDLQQFAMAAGRSAFAVNCAQCHGTGAAGARGYPNLVDDDWLWGGTPDEILQTIRFGIRSGHDEARLNQMPAFGTDGLLTGRQIREVVAHVQAISEQTSDPTLAEAGKAVFAEQCAVCHGESGAGNKELGAPNLADRIWLYGGDEASLIQTISRSRQGVMPAWEGRIDEVTLKLLAVYIHALGGGE